MESGRVHAVWSHFFTFVPTRQLLYQAQILWCFQLEYTPQKDKDEDEGDEAGAPNMTYAEAFEHAQKQAAAHNSSNSA